MKEWLRKCQLMAMLSLAGVAPALVLGVHAYPDQMWLCGAFCALHFACGCLCMALKGRARLLCGIGLSFGLIAAGFWLLPWQEHWFSMALPALYVLFLMMSLPVGGWSAATELPFNVTFIGGALYIGAQLFQMLPSGEYASIGLPLLMGFLAYAALWMLSLNRQSLTDAAARGQRAPKSMRRKNTALTIGLMALVLLVASIPALARALRWLWNRLGDALKALWQLLAALLPDTEATGDATGSGEMFGGFGPAEDPSLFAQIMEKIFMVLAIVLLVIALAAAGKILWRKLRVLFKKLWTILNRYALAASEDYVDEVEDTRREGDASSRERRSIWSDWFRQINEDRLSPVERIRYRYQRLLRRHQEWQPGSTARENLPGDAAQIYEQARYSARPVSAEEAEAFARQAKALEKK